MTMRLRNIFRAFVLFLLVFTFLAGYLSILGYGQTTTLPHRRHLEVNVSGNCVGKEVTIKTTDRGDNPIPGVRVGVYLGGIPVEKILTDSDGMASFIPADAGEYEIKLTKTRYRSREVILSVIYCEPSTTTTTTTTTTTIPTTVPTTTTTTTTTTTRVTTTSTTTTIPVTTTTLAEESDGLNIFIILFAGLLVVAFSYVLYSRFRRVEETEDIVRDRSRGEEETHRSFEEKKRKIKEELESIKKLNRELKSLRELQKKRPKRSKKSSKKPSRHRKKRSEGVKHKKG